jgi:hypothetical protein
MSDWDKDASDVREYAASIVLCNAGIEIQLPCLLGTQWFS